MSTILGLSIGLGGGVLLIGSAIFLVLLFRIRRQRKQPVPEFEEHPLEPDKTYSPVPSQTTQAVPATQNDRDWEIDYKEISFEKQIGR